MEDSYSVVRYGPDALKLIVADTTCISPSDLDSKSHIKYFDGYLSAIDVKTIVVERDYVDHDYAEDHAEYYVRCFKQYERKCSRMHLFGCEFSHDNFESLLNGEGGLTKTQLQENYLGFVVLKPLPKTVFGRTCVKTYSDNATRSMPITRSYTANLFGIPLRVENSLAFQEQDTVVAACATSALWSIFQGTGKLFQHTIPSPSVITKAATEYITDGERTRAFPSSGLDVIEMARAIKDVGLEPFNTSVKSEYLLKSTAYAYLMMKIPMILGFPLYDLTEGCDNLGKHAVALAGFNLPEGDPVPYGETNFKLVANRIDKIYVHDDQIGPFAKMEFDGQPVLTSDSFQTNKDLPSLSTTWPNKNDEVGFVRAVPEILLLPLYHKIRIPYSCVHDQILVFDRLFAILVRKNPGLCDRYEWDIYLTTVNDYKEESFDRDCMARDIRHSVLVDPMPNYIWRASVVNEGELLIDFLFDVTDLEQGSYVTEVVGVNDGVYQVLKDFANNYFYVGEQFLKERFGKKTVWPLLQWMQKNM